MAKETNQLILPTGICLTTKLLIKYKYKTKSKIRYKENKTFFTITVKTFVIEIWSPFLVKYATKKLKNEIMLELESKTKYQSLSRLISKVSKAQNTIITPETKQKHKIKETIKELIKLGIKHSKLWLLDKIKREPTKSEIKIA